MLEVLKGDEVFAALVSPEFTTRWQELHRACPWATVFQDRPFVQAWYSSYSALYEPLLVSQRSPSGPLTGLLFLGISKGSGRLVPCGASQAEYDGWLSLPDSGTTFIEAAWERLADEFPHRNLEFTFVPAATPLNFSASWQRRCVLRPFKRPLLSTSPDVTAVQDLLKKKNNRYQLKTLQQAGVFSFERITDASRFDTLLDEMIPLFDTRQYVLSGAPPFGSDPHRRAFFQAMLQSNILHVTATRVSGRLVAAHLGQVNGRQVIFGMVAHSPLFAKLSVGKLQLLLLAGQLQKEGFAALDLTAIGEYKDRLATTYDDVHILHVGLSDRSAARYRWRRRVIDAGKHFVSSERVKAAIAALKHHARLTRAHHIPGMLLRSLVRLVYESQEVRVYMKTPGTMVRPLACAMERDAVGHLLLYEPSGADDLPKDKFIHAALARLGTGHHFYSRADENRLVAWCWLKDREGTLDLGHAGGEVPLPAGSAVMTGLAVSAAGHTSPDAYRAALAEVLNEAANIPQTQQVVLRVSRTSAGLCRAAESEGFTLWLRAFRRRILWRSRCWRTGPVGGFPDSAGPSAAAARGPSASDAAPTSSEV